MTLWDKLSDKVAKSPSDCQSSSASWEDRDAAGSLATLPCSPLPSGTGCFPGTHHPPHSRKVAPSIAWHPRWKAVPNSLRIFQTCLTSSYTDLNFSTQILFYLKKLLCYITYKSETALLIILVRIFSWAVLDITKVQNKWSEISITTPNHFFFPFEIYYAWHVNDSS